MQIFIHRIIFFVFAILGCNFSYATFETYSVRHTQSDFGTAFTFEVIDGRYYELGLGHFKDKEARLLLKLGIDERLSYGYISPYSFTINATVQGYNASGIAMTPQEVTLSVDYSPYGGLTTTDLSSFVTTNGYKYEITVDAVTAPINIYLEAELRIDRFYDIDIESIPEVGSLGCSYLFYDPVTNVETAVYDVNNTSIPTGAQEFEIWWDYIEGAESYELEWTWVDNYAASLDGGLDAADIPFSTRNFELNNTRIITSAQNYRIPLIFAKGYLIYRVRGVGVWTDEDLTTTHINKYSQWSSAGIDKINIADWPHKVKLVSAHEALKNWQYQAVYAENGKKKEIVSYFDGSLRNRQTVTRINSNREAIVGENVYDNQGRSAIQILPTPIGNTALRYYPGLNLNAAGNPYGHLDFDWDTDLCYAPAAPMNTSSGASQYYTNSVDALAVENNWQDYVPNAQGYPFVQVQYTPDNTGRIRGQSGVGADYQLEGEHATRYYYLQPYQEELNRLFGYQVGYKTRYKKNLVVDANGQVSVSYIDPQGRVIATALAGDNTTGDEITPSLLSLDSESGVAHQNQVVDLLNKADDDAPDTGLDDNERFSTPTFSPLNDALHFNSQIGVTDDGVTYEFDYRIRTGVFEDECDLDGDEIVDQTIAYPFFYDLSINVTDDCGESLLLASEAEETGAYHELIGGTSTDGFITAAGADESRHFTAVLSVGAYSVSKMLIVNKAKLDEYTAHYMANNSCLLSFEDFFENTVDCPDPINPGDIPTINSCYATEFMLIGDMSPMGQYGNIDGVDITSVFNELNVLDHGTLGTSKNWRNPFTPYLDTDGSPSVIIYEGEEVAISTVLDVLSLDEFLFNWRASWANSLIGHHPEYCYVTYADQLCTQTGGTLSISSETYNNSLPYISTYLQAQGDNDFSVDLIGDPYNEDGSEDFTLKAYDPYYEIDYSVINDATDGTAGHTLKVALLDQIVANYKDSGMNLWNFSVRAVLCGGDFDGVCALPTTLSGLEEAASTGQLNQIWLTYKNLYLGEKQKVNQLFIDMYAMRHGCYNNYIGEESPSEPSLMAFAAYPEFILPSGVIGPGSGSGYTGTTILYLYVAAKGAMLGGGGLPWMDGLFMSSFAEKQPRFMRIDNLYDGGIPEDVMLDNMSEEVDAIGYGATGKCALLIDVESFLSGLAQGSILASGSSTDSDIIPTYSSGLYQAMGGTIIAPPAMGYPVTISSSTIAGGIEITVTDALDGLVMAPSIRLNNPTGLGWTWDWADVKSFEMMYYESGSETGGVYPFQILALVDVFGTIHEVVISGETEVEIGDCNLDPYCDRGDKLAKAVASLYAELYADNNLGEITGAPLITAYIGDWYAGTELQTQLLDYVESGTLTSANEDEIILIADDRQLSFTFSTDASLLDIEIITGATFNDGLITIYYIDSEDGEVKSFTATLVYDDISGASPEIIDLALNCDCDQDQTIVLEDHIKTLLNYVIDGHEGSPFYYLNPISPLTNIIPFLDLTDLEIYGDVGTETTGKFGLHNVWITSTGFSFTFEKIGGCGLSLSLAPGESGDISDIVYFSEVNIVPSDTYTDYILYATGILSDGSSILLSMGQGFCFTYPDCDNCVPELVAPQSCDVQWSAYQIEIEALNLDLDEGDDLFPSYTQTVFCESNLAYITADYLYYLESFNITSPDDDYYLSIGEFTLTDLGMGYTDLQSVIDLYETYVAIAGNEDVTWSSYVNTVYMAANTVCPPAPLYREINFEIEFPCEQFTANVDTINAMNDYATYLANTEAMFRQRYIEQAVANVIENFEATYPDKEYHYTLYYYDQAGNLVQTVPPKGVDRFETEINETEVTAARASNDDVTNGEVTGQVLPEHTFQTQYHYNSLNQLVWQSTPDGGESQFGYDELGRLVVSQNAKQAAAINPQFSYTKYDDLGRIIEVGEMTLDASGYYFDENGRFRNPLDELVAVSSTSFPTDIADYYAREEVTRTQYDELVGITSSEFIDYSADNTRNRITGVYYHEVFTLGTEEFNNATFYDYDVHGNVKEIIQLNTDEDLQEMEQDLKKVEYEYDLVSGNVKHVTYQKDQADQFIHEYEYDADNRITNVRTSKDDVIWEQDAKYFYYDHGPLARTEIGDKKVVANDYAYTIQGWLKGVNSEELVAANDQGKDSQTGMNRMNGKDVFGYSLHYFEGDYTARHGNDFLSLSGSALPYAHNRNLYNGNIKEMYTASTNTAEEYIGTSHTWYNYDQLNRIKSMDQERLYNGTTPESRYASTYSFDANGNLETLTRHAWDGTAKVAIDDFTYHYITGNNQLTHVDDALGAAVLGDDLADQDADNYSYDQIGQLITDDQEEIAEIQWKVTGKVHKIIRESGSTKHNLEFVYDAMGNRIMKIVSDNSGNVLEKYYYIRDAQGNVMSLYTYIPETGEDDAKLFLTERDIYGSSRLGVEQVNQVIASYPDPGYVTINEENGIYIGIFNHYSQTVGDKRYELSNHLGNVLEVVTDRKLQIETTIGSGVLDYYSADVVSQSDYFPFGMVLPNTNIDPSDGSLIEEDDDYRFGFNGMEEDSEISGDGNSYDFGARMYSPRIGKWFSLDPAYQSDITPYHFTRNNPINYFDINGEIQVKPNGEIIYVCFSAMLDNPKPYNVGVLSDGNGNYSKVAYETGFIFTDEGTPVLVFKVLATVSEVKYWETDKDGFTVERTETQILDTDRNKTNCYGLSLVDGEFMIPFDQDAFNIVNEEYETVKEEGSTDMSNIKVGDVASMINGGHFIKAIGTTEAGDLIWESKNGQGEVFTGTLEQLKVEHQNASMEDLLNTELLAPEHLTIVRQTDPNRVVNTGGIPYISEQGKKALLDFISSDDDDSQD